MSFLRKHWIGIVFFVAAAFAVWLACDYFLEPKLRLVRISMPIMADLTLFIFALMIKIESGKWPWHFNLDDWKNIMSPACKG